jgi:hypothetical protein
MEYKYHQEIVVLDDCVTKADIGYKAPLLDRTRYAPTNPSLLGADLKLPLLSSPSLIPPRVYAVFLDGAVDIYETLNNVSFNNGQHSGEHDRETFIIERFMTSYCSTRCAWLRNIFMDLMLFSFASLRVFR